MNGGKAQNRYPCNSFTCQPLNAQRQEGVRHCKARQHREAAIIRAGAVHTGQGGLERGTEPQSNNSTTIDRGTNTNTPGTSGQDDEHPDDDIEQETSLLPKLQWAEINRKRIEQCDEVNSKLYGEMQNDRH